MLALTDWFLRRLSLLHHLNRINTRHKFLTCHLCSSVSVAHWPSDPLHDLHPGAAVFEVKGHLPRDDVTPAAATQSSSLHQMCVCVWHYNSGQCLNFERMVYSWRSHLLNCNTKKLFFLPGAQKFITKFIKYSEKLISITFQRSLCLAF